MEPTSLFPIIVLLLLVAVEYGGWALRGFVTGHGIFGAFRERFCASVTRPQGCCWCCRWPNLRPW